MTTAESNPGRFASTHWSEVVAAAQTSSPEAEASLASLCNAYWYPLYVFLRRKGHSKHEAEDLTQEFFSQRVVTKLIFRGITRGRGKFRTWLLNSFQNFLHNEWDRARSLKRGGQHIHVPFDFEGADGRYALEPVCDQGPDEGFERAWITTVLDRTLAALRAKFEQAGEGMLFNELKGFLPGVGEPPAYATAAQRLGKSEAAVKMAVSRLRREYGQTLKAEVKRTVSDATELQEELRHFLAVAGA